MLPAFGSYIGNGFFVYKFKNKQSYFKHVLLHSMDMQKVSLNETLHMAVQTIYKHSTKQALSYAKR